MFLILLLTLPARMINKWDEHNPWHYLSFLIHLRQKRVTDYTGPEAYVAEKLERNDLSFFPILKASSIVYEE